VEPLRILAEVNIESLDFIEVWHSVHSTSTHTSMNVMPHLLLQNISNEERRNMSKRGLDCLTDSNVSRTPFEIHFKVIESHRLPSKNEAFASLPTGTHVSLDRLSDGTWSGSLAAEGATVEATASGPQALVAALAQLWIARRAAPE
jgi:hypothetical protein